MKARLVGGPFDFSVIPIEQWRHPLVIPDREVAELDTTSFGDAYFTHHRYYYRVDACYEARRYMGYPVHNESLEILFDFVGHRV